MDDIFSPLHHLYFILLAFQEREQTNKYSCNSTTNCNQGHMKTIVPLIMMIVVVLVMLIYNVEENGGMRQVTQMGKQIKA